MNSIKFSWIKFNTTNDFLLLLTIQWLVHIYITSFGHCRGCMTNTFIISLLKMLYYY